VFPIAGSKIVNNGDPLTQPIYQYYIISLFIADLANTYLKHIIIVGLI